MGYHVLISTILAFAFAVTCNDRSYAGAPALPTRLHTPSDAEGVYHIWPGSGTPATWAPPPRAEQMIGEEPERILRNIAVPSLTCFKPPVTKANGTAVVIAPGGAFHFLVVDTGGYEVARSLAERGITSFVLKYRLQYTPTDDEEFAAFLDNLRPNLPRVDQEETYPPTSHPGAEEARLWGEEDGRQAIRFLRRNARQFDIDPDRIGIIGFSAGGGIAINAALQSDESSVPNFVGGIYPGYRIVSPFPKKLPPLFLAITDDDTYVAPISASRLYEDWHKLGNSAELHVFAEGKHGFGVRRQNSLSDSWFNLFVNWLRFHGFVESDN